MKKQTHKYYTHNEYIDSIIIDAIMGSDLNAPKQSIVKLNRNELGLNRIAKHLETAYQHKVGLYLPNKQVVLDRKDAEMLKRYFDKYKPDSDQLVAFINLSDILNK